MAQSKPILRWFRPRAYEQMHHYDTPIVDWSVAIVITFIIEGPLLLDKAKPSDLTTGSIAWRLALLPFLLYGVLSAFRWICRQQITLQSDCVEEARKYSTSRSRFEDIRNCRIRPTEYRGKKFLLVNFELKPVGAGAPRSMPLRETAMPATCDYRLFTRVLRDNGVPVISEVIE
jgi:hypothetical protein